MTILPGVTGIAAVGFAGGLLFGIGTALLLRRRTALRRASVQSVTRFMYSGNLKQTNLLDAIQFLEIGRREGILHIYVGRRKGYITFAAGQIVDAFFRNAAGKEAVFQMLELDYGDFYFESKAVSQPRVITESMMDIALEWDVRRYGDSFAGGPEGEGVQPAAPAPGADGDGKLPAGEAVPPAGETAPGQEVPVPPAAVPQDLSGNETGDSKALSEDKSEITSNGGEKA